MKFRFNGQKGFSIIELMIVVGIIGVLASVGMPRMQVFLAKSKRAEAKTVLGTFSTFNEAYFADGNGYATAFGTGAGGIGYALPTPKNYAFAAGTFTAAAYSATMSTDMTAGATLKKLCNETVAEVWTTTNAVTAPTGDTVAKAAPACT